MITFLEQQHKIENYLKENYKDFLIEYDIREPEVTSDFLDLDKYKNDFTLFIEYSKLEFPVTQYADDCEHIEKLHIRIYLVLRNDTSNNLHDKLLNATFAFYKMIRKDNRLSLSEDTTITGVNFYNYVEGNKYIVASEIGLTMEISL